MFAEEKEECRVIEVPRIFDYRGHNVLTDPAPRITYWPSEVANLMGTTTKAVRNWCASGRIPAFKLGGRWLISADGLGHWVDEKVAKGKTP